MRSGSGKAAGKTTGITSREAVADVTVVVTCGSAYVVAGNTGVGGWVLIAGIAVLFAVYAKVVLSPRGESWRDYGLRTDNVRPAARVVGAWTAAGAALILLWGLVNGESFLRDEFLVMLPLYPVWGVVQQLIFQGVLHRRLLLLVKHRGLALFVTAMAFALVHLGNWPLVGLTFAAGLAWSRLFQLYPNVWVLGLSHGVLAALVYPLVLGDNPLQR